MAEIFTIFNDRIELAITNYGGRVMQWKVDGVDIILGFDTVEEYKIASEPYHSALIGRYANRIANGNFQIEDRSFQLNKNLGAHILHGGTTAFHNVDWTLISNSQTHLELKNVSLDGDQGFPGELTTIARYELVNDELWLTMQAKTTKPTPLSLTHHPYFNLSGLSIDSLAHHSFKIHSNTILPTDKNGIPSGETMNISGSSFDFQSWKSLEQSIKEDHSQLQLLRGIDHSYIFGRDTIDFQLQAEAKCQASGVHMQVYSNQPALQLYTANHFRSKDIGKRGRKHAFRGAFCFEPQQWPDSPNHLDFPNTILEPNQEFSFKMKYKFPL